MRPTTRGQCTWYPGNQKIPTMALSASRLAFSLARPWPQRDRRQDRSSPRLTQHVPGDQATNIVRVGAPLIGVPGDVTGAPSADELPNVNERPQVLALAIHDAAHRLHRRVSPGRRLPIIPGLLSGTVTQRSDIRVDAGRLRSGRGHVLNAIDDTP